LLANSDQCPLSDEAGKVELRAVIHLRWVRGEELIRSPWVALTVQPVAPKEAALAVENRPVLLRRLLVRDGQIDGELTALARDVATAPESNAKNHWIALLPLSRLRHANKEHDITRPAAHTERMANRPDPVSAQAYAVCS